MKLFSPDSAHWYQPDGVACHTVPSLKGEPRPSTLRDARKLGLYPSVTNILSVIAKPELTAWLQEQAVMAALTLPRIEGEPEDAFAKRVVADSQTTRDGAADFGTAFHHGAERVAQSLEVDPEGPIAPWLRLYRDWFQANALSVVWTERVLVSQHLGYAGTADLLIEHPVHGLTLVDLKTQGVKVLADGQPTPPSIYKSWGYQLAAYRRALGEPVACLNLIVNSREAHPPVEAPWSEAQMERCWAAFEAARRLWMIEKNYELGEKLKAETLKPEMPMPKVVAVDFTAPAGEAPAGAEGPAVGRGG